ncbi:hypothetical protein POSPLADRAFT_1045025 [Postia placenta MAD-698-R-SB12]|uniref:Uncharacterized protein n=1 Tax=Postia placenta MAD-698-R-SB12 TaxID=670580 RepID=A0A1X6N5G0_9APHY|nr:hypothetical protein POSPLADRAFT_1045025 [Postia placenta MAD-698-R-SB12]OSX63848.1 hypothetical protein POSPLADRAFT_1045025 [Postia placenta MAD-698-R-SB12]
MQQPILQFGNHGSCFVYSKPPPRVASDSSWHGHIHYPELKEWGAAVDEEELFLTSELEEFEDISVDSVWKEGYQPPRLPARDIAEDNHIVRPAPAVETVKRRASTDLGKPLVETEEPPRKRRRLDDDSLYTALPQPHFLPSPSKLRSLQTPIVDSAGLNAPRKTRPISPHSAGSLKDYLEDPYARAAWIVPVRGFLPWDCSSACMLSTKVAQGEPEQHKDQQLLLPCPLGGGCDDMNVEGRSDITWTADALAAFWNFLLSLRSACTLGPLSLSFHAASASHTGRSASSFPSAGHAQDTHSSGAHSRNTGTATDARPHNLLSVDHIKVYHDAPYSTQIRNVLAAWRYTYSCSRGAAASDSAQLNGLDIDNHDSNTMHSPERAVAGHTGRIRLFKGAKLVLVNERSKGILIS